MSSVFNRFLMSAASILVVSSTALAADAPGKAKAKAPAAPAAPVVEYVKICSTYGASFYFIPGSDTCLRIGGYVRVDAYANYNAGGGLLFNWSRNTTAQTASRVRAVLDIDARSNTDYGTLRSYVRMGMQNTTVSGQATIAGNNALYYERAFIQLGGLTAGYLQSFFDYYTGFSYATPNGGSNRWTTVLAYTAKFGDGVSGTLSLEDAANRRVAIRDLGTANVINTTTSPGNGYAGQAMPDVVANLRIDQTWGNAQLSAAVHQIRPAYFTPAVGTFITPDTDYGFAVQAGVTFNLPMLGTGDTLVLQGAYSDGAVDYVAGFNTSPISPASSISVNKGGSIFGSGAASSVFAIPVMDAYIANGNIETTEAWNVTAAYRHFWTPTLRTAVWGTYTSVDLPEAAVWVVKPATNVIGVGTDFKYLEIGTNTVWSPVKNMDIGVELLYAKIDPAGSKDFNAWGGMLRFQRNF